MSSQFLLALPIEAMPLGARYERGESLPLHCMVMRWFRLACGYSIEDFIQDLEHLTTGQFAIDLVSWQPALFGPHNDVPVHILEEHPALIELHVRLFVNLAVRRSLPEELRWIGAGYRPHVSDTARARFAPGMRYHARVLALVERSEDGAKTVIAHTILSTA